MATLNKMVNKKKGSLKLQKYRPSNNTIIFTCLIILIVALRLFMMVNVPLMDTTEARYGELSRVTALGNFWLMPHMSPSEPFFAKPPLSFWFSSIGWLAFGQNEFALRLPSLILTLLSCLGILYAKRTLSLTKEQWLFACFVILSAPIGFISAGAVMTEATQLVVICWAMAFLTRILFTQDSSNLNRDLYGFWITVGLGAITKGLATEVLIALPVLSFWLLSPKIVYGRTSRKYGFCLG